MLSTLKLKHHYEILLTFKSLDKAERDFYNKCLQLVKQLRKEGINHIKEEEYYQRKFNEIIKIK